MITLNFTPFPILRTERLILRPPAIGDRNETYFMRTDERVNKYVDRSRPVNVAEAEQFIEKLISGINNNESIAWVITLKESPMLIGSICLWNISVENSRAEIGFELHPAYQGKGIMLETMQKVLEYGFKTMKLKVIDAWVHEQNAASIKILEKNAFIRNHEMESKMSGKDYFKNMMIWSLTSMINE
jgi:ribosomal-protein-alanine N-acetyltransferase